LGTKGLLQDDLIAALRWTSEERRRDNTVEEILAVEDDG
jgi:hypothetical protein